MHRMQARAVRPRLAVRRGKMPAFKIDQNVKNTLISLLNLWSDRASDGDVHSLPKTLPTKRFLEMVGNMQGAKLSTDMLGKYIENIPALAALIKDHNRDEIEVRTASDTDDEMQPDQMSADMQAPEAPEAPEAPAAPAAPETPGDETGSLSDLSMAHSDDGGDTSLPDAPIEQDDQQTKSRKNIVSAMAKRAKTRAISK